MQRPERKLQRKILTELFRGYRFSVRFHCPNGGKRNPREAYNLKLDGVLAGVSDLIIARPHGRTGWIEVKDEGEQPSDVQVEFARMLAVLGHKVWLVDNIAQIADIIAIWREEDGINIDHGCSP